MGTYILRDSKCMTFLICHLSTFLVYQSGSDASSLCLQTGFVLFYSLFLPFRMHCNFYLRIGHDILGKSNFCELSFSNVVNELQRTGSRKSSVCNPMIRTQTLSEAVSVICEPTNVYSSLTHSLFCGPGWLDRAGVGYVPSPRPDTNPNNLDCGEIVSLRSTPC